MPAQAGSHATSLLCEEACVDPGLCRDDGTMDGDRIAGIPRWNSNWDGKGAIAMTNVQAVKGSLKI